MALLCLMLECRPELLRGVATVDHGLRSGVEAEHDLVRRLCAGHGVAHVVLTWAHEDALSGNLQAAARHARYQLLSQWGREAELDGVLLAHTQDDVAEGFLIRLARGSSVEGLSEMARAFSHEGMRFMRPLLDIPRATLRDYLEAKGQPWVEDPSNEDRRFTRVRMRQALPELEALGLHRKTLAQTAKSLRRAREVVDVAVGQVLAEHARVHEWGVVSLPYEAFLAQPEEVQLRVLARALRFVSGAAYPPRLTSLEALWRTVLRRERYELGGVMFWPHSGQLHFFAAPPPQDEAEKRLAARWIIEGPPLSATQKLRPLGLAQTADLRKEPCTPLRRALAQSPAIFENGELRAAPLLDKGPWRARFWRSAEEL